MGHESHPHELAADMTPDLGPPNWLHPRCLRLRQPSHEHDVRSSSHRGCGWRERGEGLRQDGWAALGLRQRRREEQCGEGEGQGWVFDRGEERWGGGDLDLLIILVVAVLEWKVVCSPLWTLTIQCWQILASTSQVPTILIPTRRQRIYMMKDMMKRLYTTLNSNEAVVFAGSKFPLVLESIKTSMRNAAIFHQREDF